MMRLMPRYACLVRHSRKRPIAGARKNALLGNGDDRLCDVRRIAGRHEEAERHFRDFCTMQGLMVAANPANVNGPSAELHQEVGDAQSKLAEYGRTSDLIVLGRMHEHPAVSRLRLVTAIMDTGRPVLIASNNAARST
jgi:hypothetical protein